jgi:hypothetical protein
MIFFLPTCIELVLLSSPDKKKEPITSNIFTYFSTRCAVVSLKKFNVGRISVKGNYHRESRHLNEFLKCILIKILITVNYTC